MRFCYFEVTVWAGSLTWSSGPGGVFLARSTWCAPHILSNDTFGAFFGPIFKKLARSAICTVCTTHMGSPVLSKTDLQLPRKWFCPVSTAHIACTRFHTLFEQFCQKRQFARQVRHLLHMCLNTSRHRRGGCSCPHTQARHRYRNACFG